MKIQLGIKPSSKVSNSAFVNTRTSNQTRCNTENMGDSSFEQFCSKTTAHGFVYLNTQSKRVRTCWIVIVIFAFLAGVLHLHAIVWEYREYKYHETTVTSTDVYPMFPDITICDNSGISEASMAE